VTIRDHHATCDGCPQTGPATAAITSPWFEQWERIEMRGDREAHLCPACQEKRDRGILAEPFYIECVRCGRNTKDNPDVKRWRQIPSDPGDRPRSVCRDCFDAAPDDFPGFRV
jgi:hypothetical protein